jgi:hypothetical protein
LNLLKVGLLGFAVSPYGCIGGLSVPVLEALPPGAAVCLRAPDAGLGGIPYFRLILSIRYSNVSSCCKAYLFDGVSDY